MSNTTPASPAPRPLRDVFAAADRAADAARRAGKALEAELAAERENLAAARNLVDRLGATVRTLEGLRDSIDKIRAERADADAAVGALVARIDAITAPTTTPEEPAA